jgi:hypothetical protein
VGCCAVSLAEVYRRFRGVCCRVRLTYRADDGGSMHIWNIGKLLPNYTAQHPRRLLSSYSLPWEPETSAFKTVSWEWDRFETSSCWHLRSSLRSRRHAGCNIYISTHTFLRVLCTRLGQELRRIIGIPALHWNSGHCWEGCWSVVLAVLVHWALLPARPTLRMFVSLLSPPSVTPITVITPLNSWVVQ